MRGLYHGSGTFRIHILFSGLRRFVYFSRRLRAAGGAKLMYVSTGYQFNLSYDRICRMSCFASLSNAERVGVRRCDIANIAPAILT